MLRITGGEFRGRSIRTPKNLHTRPTQARLRQALFNSLQVYVPEARVLDLFSGSGALAFEALSRGASHVTLVENSRVALKLIEQNIEDLKVSDRVSVVEESVDRLVSRLTEPFDVILADPPYSEGWEMKLILEFPWEKLLVPEGHFSLEWGTVKSKVDELPDETPFLVKIREKNYGDSVLTTYRRKPSA